MNLSEKANLNQVDRIRMAHKAFQAAVAKIEENAIHDLAVELFLDPEVVRDYWKKLTA
jgi:hypothetical protein